MSLLRRRAPGLRISAALMVGLAAAALQSASASPPGAPASTATVAATAPAGSAEPRAAMPAQEALVEDLMRERRVSRATAIERIGWQEKAGDLQNELPSKLGERFGGTWIGADDDRVKVGVVGHAGGLRELAPAMDLKSKGLETAVDIVPVRHSMAKLQRVHAWVSARLAAVNFGRSGSVGVALAPQRNAVELLLPPGSPLSPAQTGLVKAAEARFGTAVQRAAGPGREDARACHLAACDLPLRGGIRIVGARANCTGGFVVRSRIDSAPYLLTAGHCLTIGQDWALNKPGGGLKYIGPVHNKISPPYGDAGIIRIKYPSTTPVRPWIYVAANPAQRILRNPAYPIRSLARSVVGARVCFTGAVSGSRCGKVTIVGWNSYRAGSNATVASFCSKSGDSGGPIFSYGRAYGVVSGGWNDCTGTGKYGTSYTELSRSLDLLRVKLVLAP